MAASSSMTTLLLVLLCPIILASDSCSGRNCEDPLRFESSVLLQNKHVANFETPMGQAPSSEDTMGHTSRTVCPTADEVRVPFAAAWKEFVQNVCRVSWDDAPEKLRKNIDSGDLTIVPMDNDCKAIVQHGFSFGPGDLGCVVKHGKTSWEIKPDSLAVEQVMYGACDELIPAGTPEVVALPGGVVNKVFNDVQKDFQDKCKGDRHGLGFKSLVSAKRTTSTSENAAEWEYILKLLVSPKDAEDEVIEVIVEEIHADDDANASEQRQLLWEQRHQQQYRADHPDPAEADEDQTDDGKESLLAVGDVPDINLLPTLGKLLVRDDRYQPRLECLCGKCLDNEDDAEDTGSPALVQNLVIGIANLTVPSLGDPNSFRSPARSVHPDADLSGKRWTGPRARSEPRLGDNFHSTILNQRSAADHARVWAQSRALVSELKYSGIPVPDEYNFFDDDNRAKCYQPAYSQGECGSCWAFASLGALEKQICMKSGGIYKPSLSREMLVRCSEQNGACEGGNADKAYEDLMEIGGVWSTDCLPYQGKGSKHCPAFSYSWFGQGSTGKTGNMARIDQEIMKSCSDLTRFSNRPPMGTEWDMPFIMMYEARLNDKPNMSDPRVARFRKSFAKARSRDRVPSWWLYGEEAMKAALTKYGAIYASYIAQTDFKKRKCDTGCWPPGTVWGEEAEFRASDCGCPKNGHAVQIIGYGTDIQETGIRVPYWLIENSWGTEVHGNMMGEDVGDIKGFGKDPFTELHPAGLEDKCLIAGWYASILPKTGGCAGKFVNIRNDIPVTGGDPDGFSFGIEVDGKVIYNQSVAADSSGMFMQDVSLDPGKHSVKFLVYAKNHPKQQALPLEDYAFEAVKIRCRGRGYVYSFTNNDAKANLSWGRKTRDELKAEADKLLSDNGVNVNAKFDKCPEACRTGSYSAVIPCEGLLTTWGSCYTDDYYKRPNNYYVRNDYYTALCWNCTLTAVAMEEQALATKSLDNETFIQWHSLVQQAFDAPDAPGWMRQFLGSCTLKSMGHNKNTQMTAAYEIELPNGADGAGGCDETHSAPFEQGQYVQAPGAMTDGSKATARCPMPMKGDAQLACTNGVLTVESHTCEARPTQNLSSRGYFKILRGHNYHGIEEGAAFAIAEMTRFLDVCPTSGWTKWSSCNATAPCQPGIQSRSRNPVNGFSKQDQGCAQVSFDQERPCVGPGFCKQVLTRFASSIGADIEEALSAYKKQSTTIQSNSLASAGAHFMETANPSCQEAKYWCRVLTGNDKCGMVIEGNFEIKSSGDYVITYGADSGSGNFEFNTLGKGNEGKAEYQVRASSGGGADMFVWQDVGFHHRRRRSDSKPWQSISSIFLEKGSYFGRMTRTGWSQCPNFQLAIEESTSSYTKPLLSGVVAVTEITQDALGAGTQQQRSWDVEFNYRRRRRWKDGSDKGPTNELIISDDSGNDFGKQTIDRVNFTADELYQMFNIDKRSPTLQGASSKKFFMTLRTTVVLPAAGTYKFRYTHDTSKDETNAEWRVGTYSYYQSVRAQVGGRTGIATETGYSGSYVLELSHVATQPGEVSFEMEARLPTDGVADHATFPNFMELEVKKEDLQHRGSAGSLPFGTRINHMSELNVLYGDDEARVDWPDRDDPFSSEIRASTFKELPRNKLLIGKDNFQGFIAEIEGRIDAGACLSLNAFANGADSSYDGFRGLSLELCDIDGGNQYLELAAVSGINGSTRKQLGWVHIGFTQPTHLRMRRDPNNVRSIEVSYRPDNRLFYADPFSSTDIAQALGDFDGNLDVGVSMVSGESYRYAEFYNITIEECTSSCNDANGQQLYCGEVVTACGTKLTCNSDCSDGYQCHDQTCMSCPALTLTDAQKSASCGSVAQVCKNHKDQSIVVEQPIGFPAPTAYHSCKDGNWECQGRTKWSYLADGKVCGQVTDNCLNDVDLFPCPNARDECINHQCVCDPAPFDPNYECGWDSDGCGRNVTFGALGGQCSSSNHVCNGHMCCLPKTTADFNAAWECGTADDGCGGTVYFSRDGSADNSGCGAGRYWSCDIDHKCQNTGPQYSCSFEDPPVNNRFCDFFDNEKGPGTYDVYWTRKSGTTPSGSTGPSSAGHGNYYVFTESSSPGSNKQALLKSIPFKVSASGGLAFRYHMFGSSMGSLKVRVVRDGVSTEEWTKSGNQGNAWYDASKIDLSKFADSTVQIVFDGKTGSSYTSDIAIDDVEIF